MERNRHFNMHCWCLGVDDRTTAAVRRIVSEADIPVLIEMLDDKKSIINYAARGVLVDFGEAAVPALEVAARSGRGEHILHARLALIMIEATRKQH